MEELLAALGLKKGAVIAGLAGGLVSYLVLKNLPALELVISMCSGVLVAIFVGPLVAEMVKASERSEYGIIFLMGVLGILSLMKIAAQIELWLTGLREKWMK